MHNLLSWRENNESAAVAVFAHRAAMHGFAVRTTEGGYAIPDGLRPAAERLGLVAGETAGEPTTPDLHPPRIVLYAGAAIGYPYYAYYAHCLLSLGLSYRQADANDLVNGALDDADLLVMPGGFATWGLDRAEDCPGVDEAVKQFVARGGAFIGSCGGAFYLSEGRPGWLGLVDAKPKFTHEYLQTGAGIVNLRLNDPILWDGLPRSLEMPYYHGPVYGQGAVRATPLAVFEGLALPSRLFIDNPLERSRFENDMRGEPAIMLVDAPEGRALVFSPHPEMGDFVRKAVALDGYVRKYLPIRGAKVMDETLRFYAKEDCLSFRLVLNAMIRLRLFAGGPGPAMAAGDPDAHAGFLAALEKLDAARKEAVALFRSARLPSEDTGLAELIERDLARLQGEWKDHLATLKGKPGAPSTRLDTGTIRSLGRLFSDSAQSMANLKEMPVAQGLALLELPVRVAAAVARIARADSVLEK